MKSLVAFSVAVLGLFLAGYLTTKTITEKISQSCARGESSMHYTNSWRDTYWVGDWWQNRDDDQGFVDCVGPAEYIRYRPYDMAALSLVIAAAAGWIGYKSETIAQPKARLHKTTKK